MQRKYLVTAFLSFFLLSSLVTSRADTRQKVGNLSFAVPKNWTCKPATTGPGVAIMSPTTHKWGPITRKDVFLARALPAQGQSLEELKHIMETVSLEQAQKMNAELKRRTGTPLNLDMTKDFSIKSRKITIGKVSGYEFTARNVLLVEGQAVRIQGRTIIADSRNTRYIVSATFEVERAKEMKPIADAFLASLRFEGGR